MQELFKEKAVRCYRLYSGQIGRYPSNYKWETSLRSGTPKINYSDHYILNNSISRSCTPHNHHKTPKSFNIPASPQNSTTKRISSSQKPRKYKKISNSPKIINNSFTDQNSTPLKTVNTLIAKKMFYYYL